MSTSYVKKYGTKAETTSTPGRSQVIQDNKKRTNVLQDNSWIKKRPDEDVDKEENFGKAVLNRYKSEESLDSNADRKTSSEIKNPLPSQDTLTKRHSTSEVQLNKFKEADDKYKRQSWTTTDGKSSTSVTKSVTSRTTPDGKTTTVTTQQKLPTKTWGSPLKDDPYGTHSTTTNKSETTEVKRFSTSQSDVQSTDKTADLKDPSSTTLKTIDGTPLVSATTKTTKTAVTNIATNQESIKDGTPLVSASTKTTKTAVTNIATNQESIKDGTPLVSASTKTTKTAVTNIATNQESIKDGNLVPVPTTKTAELIDQSTAQQKSDKGKVVPVPTTKNAELTDQSAAQQKSDKGYWDSVKTDSSVKSPVTTTTTTTRELDIVKSGSSLKSPVSTTTITGPLDDLYGSLVPTAKTASYSINRKSEPRTEYSYEYTDGTSTQKTSVSSRRSESSYDIDFSPAEHMKTTYKDNSSPQSNLYEDTVSTKTTKTLYSSSDSYGYESSPTVYTKTTYKDNSSPQTNMYEDTVSSKSIKTVYSTPDRSVIEKDMCTYCRKPMSTDAKMILDEMQICCHASCFKCEVCNCSLGQLKAGDSLWIYRRTVHCENCFTNTREKWHR
ncbi:sciellin-like isoform X2 [Acipenser ruthenus]|uniref:sciellin-like isoform X2 n=1 Tax=Acipenser ruthenus TaxID=7906 RepID=UPI0027403DA0|nr:sciellin-like isoform X2 [Acipenser ruthenus]